MEEAKITFKNLKKEFLKKPLLITPDQTLLFEIECDASKYAIGAILYQRDRNGNKHPVCFYSKTLTPPEQNYDIHDRELLAIIQSLEEWRHYLEGAPQTVTIWSDHRNLTHWKKSQKVNQQQARWYEFLARFDYKIENITGKNLSAPDALS
jgi:hypothetical protein